MKQNNIQYSKEAKTNNQLNDNKDLIKILKKY